MKTRERLRRKKYFLTWGDMRSRARGWAEARARYWANVEHRTFESERERKIKDRIPQWIVNMVLGRYEERGDRKDD